MISSVNIPAVLIANAMGLVILFAVAVGNAWRTKETSRKNRYLSILFFSCLISCVADPLGFIADGRAGLIFRILSYACNTWIFFGNLVTGTIWVLFVAESIHIRLSVLHRTFLKIFSATVILLLIINLFTPVLFTIDADNVYRRTDFYLFYTASYVLLILDGLILYLTKRRQSGGLKFFPAWAFIIPATLGLGIQTFVYGVSTITPFVTVSIICIILSMQNEYLFTDKLTEQYNRFYLNILEKKQLKRSGMEYTAIMLDINGFKEINDRYGHNEGDKALIFLSGILTDVVNHSGEIIRYAGDEFIIILNTTEDAVAEDTIARIHKALDDFNRSGKTPYEISVSEGHCRLCFGQKSMDEYIDEMDMLMYKNKREYYKIHAEYNRRKNKE